MIIKTPNIKIKEQTVQIIANETTHILEGNLSIPEGTQGIVVFAHGSGSSRFSPRNQFVAEGLHQGGLATLLLDLLTTEEEREYGLPEEPHDCI
jgi:putative phosphoribosyl transferase